MTQQKSEKVKDEAPSDTVITSGMAAEMIVRLMIVGVFGSLSFLIAAEALREAENGNLSFSEFVVSLSSVIYAVIVIQSLVRLWVFFQIMFKNWFADELAVYATDPTILHSQDSQPTSDTGTVMQTLVLVGIAAVLATIAFFAQKQGESTVDICVVCTIAAGTMFSLNAALGLRNRGFWIAAVVTGTGAIAVCLFWLAVATLIAADELNFSNADPAELAMVSMGILFGGIILAAIAVLLRIRRILRHHIVKPGTEKISADVGHNR